MKILVLEADLAENARAGLVLVEDAEEGLPDLTGLLARVDSLPDTRLLVVSNHRCRLRMVRDQTLLEGVSVVVGALDERLAGDVVLHVGLGGVEDLVVRAAGGGVNETAGDTRNEETVVDLEFDGVLKLLLASFEHFVELLGLDDGTRETIKDKARQVRLVAGLTKISAFNVPVLALLVVVQFALDHVDHDLVADETALVHDLLGFLSELGLLHDL